jgi:dTDP-glucose 4,6-dehydratase
MNLDRPLPSEDLDYISREAATLWPQLKGARLFVTGATGFFGRWLLESLFSANERHDLGVRVVALSRDPEAFLDSAPHLRCPGLGWTRGSVATLEAEAFEGVSFDMVIHLATEANMQSSQANPLAAVGVITEGTRRALEVAARTGARRFLFTSSGAVYGPQPQDLERISENYHGMPDPSDTASLYALPGEAKRHAELLCLKNARQDGPGAVIARCFTFAGPRLPTGGKFAFGNFMRDALDGGPIFITGDGTTIRSYLYAADLAVWLWTLLLRGTPGRVYNVGSEQAVSMRQLAEAMAAELGSQGIEVLQHAKPGSAPDRYVPSTHRAREELGLREQFNLSEIIQRTAAWHRAEVKH